MNIREIAYAHYLPEKSRRRRANTVEGYRSALRLHVIPRWGDCEIQDIDPDELQDWVDSFELPGAADGVDRVSCDVPRPSDGHHRVLL